LQFDIMTTGLKSLLNLETKYLLKKQNYFVKINSWSILRLMVLQKTILVLKLIAWLVIKPIPNAL